MLSIVLILVALIATWRSPAVGIAIAAHGYVIRNALSTTGQDDPVASIGLPVAVLLLTLLRLLSALIQRIREGLGWPPTIADVALTGLVPLLWLNGLQGGPGAMDYAFRYMALAWLPYVVLRVYASIHQTRISELIQQYLWTTIVLSLVVGAAIIINPATHDVTSWQRTTAGAANVIPTALLVGVAAVSALTIGVLGERGRATTLARLATIPLLYLLLLLNTRSAFLGIALAVLLLMVRLSRRLNRRNLTRLTVGALAVIGLWFTAVEFAPATVDSVMSRLNELGTDGGGQSTEQRIGNYALAEEAFAAAPVFGKGTAYNTDSTGIYPHNVLLELASEQGLVGLIAGLCIIGSGVVIAGRHLLAQRTDAYTTALMLVVVYNMAVALVSFSLWQHKVWFTALALLLTWAATQRHAVRVAQPGRSARAGYQTP